MIPIVWALALGSLGPVKVDLDPCLSQWVATASVAALLEIELSPRPLELGADAEAHLGCADGRAEVRTAARRWALSIAEVAPRDRARALALALAEELRAEAPGAPRLSAPPSPAPTSSSRTAVTASAAEGWAFLAGSTAMVSFRNAQFIGLAQVSALLRQGDLRPRVGGGLWGAPDSGEPTFGAFLSVGADLALYRDEDWRFGVEASAAGGLYLQVKEASFSVSQGAGTEPASTTSVGPYALLSGGLFVERALDPASAISVGVGVGTFVPLVPTAMLSVGLRVDP